MSGHCVFCAFTQYCDDCQQEQEPEQTQEKLDIPPASGKKQKVIISGDTLYHNGRPFQIVDSEKGNPNTKYFTQQGFVFFVRQVEGKPVLIKIQTGHKNGKKPECPTDECHKMLVGPLPQQLVIDKNW